jgi:hypothetical protein
MFINYFVDAIGILSIEGRIKHAYSAKYFDGCFPNEKYIARLSK